MSFIGFENTVKKTQNRNLSVISFIYYNIKIYLRARDNFFHLTKIMLSKINPTISLMLFFALVMPAAVFSIDKTEVGKRNDGKFDLITIKKDFKSPEAKNRRDALSRLSKIRNPEKLDLLKNAMKDKDPYVRGGAVIALSGVKAPEAFDILLASLKSKDKHTRWGAIEGLANLKDSRAVKALSDLMKHEDKITRWKVAEALGGFKGGTVLNTLHFAAMNEKEYVYVRKAAIRSLVKIGDKRSVSKLNSLKDSKNHSIAKMAKKAVLILKKKKRGI